MTLVKTSLLNGISVIIKVASALALNKILAVYVGPGGYAIIGQFQNAVSIVSSIAGGVVAQGVTKMTAQHFDNEVKQHAIWQTAIRFSLAASLLVGFGLLLSYEWWSEWLLHRTDMSNVFLWLALTLPAMAANNLLLAITNGKKEVVIYVKANIIASLVSLLTTGGLTYFFGLFGALVAFTINPGVALLTTGAMVYQCNWFSPKYLWGKIDLSVFRELSGFGLMALTSALVGNISYIIIRDHLASKLGVSSAGYWQATYKISEMYSMLVTSTLAVYYLPRLAEIRTAPELKFEIIEVYRVILPIVALGALALCVLRDDIIQILFTPDFLAMRDLFYWQFCGEVIKVASWILGYVMLGRAMIKIFIVSEIVCFTSFVFLSWFLVSIYGLVGVSIAYAVNYGLYWIGMLVVVKNEMHRMRVVI
ncbi:MAG: hypothetical protein RLZZ601_108 [Pseudomonadota bacterium]|jgi:PST family polysaccharide transporter